MVQKLGHELGEYLAALQPVAVLREHARVPHQVVGRKSHEPAVQKIVVQLLHQLAFRPDAVEHLQQQGAQQLLRRDRRTAFARVKPRKATVQLSQHQASGSSSADGSPAPAPQAKCTKTADADPKIPPACKPPPIRDRKTESANPRYGEGFFSELLESFEENV